MKNAALDLCTTQNHCISNVVLENTKKIVADLMRYRRMLKSSKVCATVDCPSCIVPHFSKIRVAVEKNAPVLFVLPSFPGKSPNPEKVLGHLPDHAERIALHFLGTLCQKIKTYYLPGIKIIICSDGRVFSDVIGMKDEHVTAYQLELSKLLSEMVLPDIMLFNLDDCYAETSFSTMRDTLMKHYGRSVDFVKYKVREGAKILASLENQEANRMFCGITRFLFEDAMYAGQTKSRATIQKESRINAYTVINRSNAWSALIEAHFPTAVRLSIHPQLCGSKKLGIRLIGDEIWMTPWHGVAVETTSGYVLLKRAKAEALGAELIFSENGSPSHYKLRGSYEL